MTVNADHSDIQRLTEGILGLQTAPATADPSWQNVALAALAYSVSMPDHELARVARSAETFETGFSAFTAELPFGVLDKIEPGRPYEHFQKLAGIRRELRLIVYQFVMDELAQA